MQRNINISKTIDWWTVGLYLLLIILGWFNIFAAVYNEEHRSIFDISQQYGKQLIWILSSIIIAIIILFTDSSVYQIFAYPIFFLILVLTILVLLIGTEINGQKAWFVIGWVRIQPSEFLKFAVCLTLAKFMSSYNFKIHKPRNLIILTLFILTPMLVVFMQHDTGTAIVFTSFIFMLYREGLTPYVMFLSVISIVLFITSLMVSQETIIYSLLILSIIIFALVNGQLTFVLGSIAILIGIYLIFYLLMKGFNFSWLTDYFIISVAITFSVLSFLLGILKKIKYASIIAIFLLSSIAFTFTVDYIFNHILKPHQQARINELLGKSSDPKGTGYNVNQSKIAIGSGGFWGKGFLQGTQTKYNFVPEQSTDFIFCTVGEEHGFVGSVLLLLLYVALLIRLIFLAERQRLAFSRIYGYGVVSILFFHFVINIGMTIGIVPVIGIPLPFFSYGGSSLWAFTILLFIFLKLDVDRFKYLT
ncbi:MAG: rod shape-determining protein RodA [Bacteroidales bacterium]|nr:rod shape-determining protein RodA [Bacteroidales bacterium]